MITVPQLKTLAKEHNMCCTYMNIDEIVAQLKDKRVITTADISRPKVEKKRIETETVKREVSPKHRYLKSIRNNPKTVEVRNRETGEVVVCPSPYMARRAGINHHYIKDGNVWRGRYDIKVR